MFVVVMAMIHGRLRRWDTRLRGWDRRPRKCNFSLKGTALKAAEMALIFHTSLKIEETTLSLEECCAGLIDISKCSIHSFENQIGNYLFNVKWNSFNIFMKITSNMLTICEIESEKDQEVSVSNSFFNIGASYQNQFSTILDFSYLYDARSLVIFFVNSGMGKSNIELILFHESLLSNLFE